jgi:hypothetical protein
MTLSCRLNFREVRARRFSLRSIMNRRAEFATLIDVACLKKVHDRGASTDFRDGVLRGGMAPLSGTALGVEWSRNWAILRLYCGEGAQAPDYKDFAISSVIFFASPSTIMVLSR